eukprot:g37302.t1
MPRREPTPYMAFFDLTKVIDTIDWEALWSILLCFCCTMKFVAIFRLFHDNVEVVVNKNGSTNIPFPFRTGVKRGCIIAPTLFLIYLAAMLHITADKHPAGVKLTYRTCGKLINLRSLQTKTKVSSTSVIKLQYADDACVCAISEDILQITVNTFTEAYTSMGLTLNIHKTKVLHQPGLALWCELPIVKVHGEALESVDYFQCLKSVLSVKTAIDEEIQHCLLCASTAFGRLGKREFENNNNRSDTKIMVYRAVMVLAILYSPETWTVYSKHLKVLEQYHQCCLRKILRIRWEERCTNTSVFNQANIPSIKALNTFDRLQWAGHVIRTTDTRLPKQ